MLEIEGGFLAYKDDPTWDHLLLTDIFIRPDLRRSGLGSRLTQKVFEIARERKKACIVGYATVDSKTCAQSVAAQIAIGFVPFLAENGKIWLRKMI